MGQGKHGKKKTERTDKKAQTAPMLAKLKGVGTPESEKKNPAPSRGVGI